MNGSSNMDIGFSLSRVASFHTVAYQRYMTSILNITFGARTVEDTDQADTRILNIKYASPTGTGVGTIGDPYSIVYGVDSLIAGDLLLLRGGAYDIPTTALRALNKNGTEANPIIIESYPGETAILDGKNRTPQDIIDGTYLTNYGLYLYECTHIHVRKIEITGMERQGTFLNKSSHCIIEGCDIHDNFLTGVHLYDANGYTTPYASGWNTIRDNRIYNNSDADIPYNNVHDDGNNADGISVSSGMFNLIHHNTIYGNADDGVDTWRSNDTEVFYNIVYDNGRGLKGNGNGIKMGGNTVVITDPVAQAGVLNGYRAFAHHNLSYGNRNDGFDQNAGKDVKVENNVAWGNGGRGFTFLRFDSDYAVDSLKANISLDNVGGDDSYPTDPARTNNSWNIGGTVEFISTEPDNANFLRPLITGAYNEIGAYILMANPSLQDNVPIWILGDSTVCDYNPSETYGGYGTFLKSILKNPDRVMNTARSGASSKSYKPTSDSLSYSPSVFWGDGSTLNVRGEKGVKQLIAETDTSNGGYLFIPFGVNDAYITGVPYNVDKTTVPNVGNEFDIETMEYITYAKEQGVTPILVTPSPSMNVHNNALHYLWQDDLAASTPPPYEHLIGTLGDWKQTLIDVANRENVLCLDVTTIVANHYLTFATNAEVSTAYAHDGVDTIHTSDVGATMIANYVKDLADAEGLVGFSEQFV